MISVDRFIARSSNRDMWLAARAQGVTATMVAKAATTAGFAQVVADILDPKPVVPDAFMEWGTFREPFIALEVKDRYGIMPNEWLIAKDSGLNRWQMATPDGLSLDHTFIAEIKTGGSEFVGIPIAHRRQMQWQMFVTDTHACVYAYERRLVNPDGSFQAAFAPVFELYERDEAMIRELVSVAEQVQQNIVYNSWDEMDALEGDLG